MNVRPVGTELFHADGHTNRHDEANSRFSPFYERAEKHNTLLYRHKCIQLSLSLRLVRLESCRGKIVLYCRACFDNLHQSKRHLATKSCDMICSPLLCNYIDMRNLWYGLSCSTSSLLSMEV